MLNQVDFRCCQDPGSDLVARRLIADFSAVLKSTDGLGEVSALILTGSFARGEGSVLKLSDRSYKILGDIEFLAVIGKKSDVESLTKSIATVQGVFGERLRKMGITCKVEVTPALPRFFKRLRPRIFDYELIQHGKTIWGERAYLENIPKFSPGQISKIDPIFLLFNRIVEQLALLLMIESEGKIELIDATYPMAKVYMDLATSILAYTGNFEDTYRNRSKRFSELVSSHALGNEEWFGDHIGEKVAYWTEAKLRPKPEHFMPAASAYEDKKNLNTQFLVEWIQVAQFVRSVLTWEIRKYLDLEDSTDLRELLWSFAKSFELPIRTKEWIKFHICSRVPSEEKSVIRTLRLFRRGSPRSLIYFCCALIYFEIADEMAIGGSLDTWKWDSSLTAFIPTDLGERRTSRRGFIRHLLRDWELYLRNN
jgi:hypothetical protein